MLISCWKQACFYFWIKCPLCLCGCRSSSKPEKRSLALMSKLLSPSLETAVQSTWGKVCMPVSELQRGQNHVQVQFDVTGLDLFQCLMYTWRWLGMRWRRALREKHLEVWRTSCWPWVRMDACFFNHQTFNTTLWWLLNCWLFSYFEVKCARSVPAYFAETLYYAMKVKSNYYFFLQRYLVWS